MYNYKQNNLLSFEITNILRGIAIMLVILAHIGGNMGTNLLTPLGGTGVAIFLFLSGYGLNEAFKKKGVKDFWKNRIIKVFIPYFILITIISLFEKDFSIKEYILDILGIKTSYWYIAFLLRQYIIYYITTRFFYRYRLYILFVISFIFVFTLPNIEAEQAFSFYLGLFSSEYYSKVSHNLKNNMIKYSFIFFLTGTIFLAIKQLPEIREFYGHYIYSIIELFIKLPYALFFILIIHKINCLQTNRIAIFSGKISYELYLIHMIFLKYIDMKIINVFIILIVSYLLAYIFYKINNLISIRLKKYLLINRI